ncbi:MAG: hypothetical protein ONB56_18590 [candidate division KSB1 bacterium]|nr:hypothetical protein [candidate division KSB1 bacterium]MDZ7397831.1 hypothetical protein [candidate division KSB1 bacterium]MDZ7411886.1 hypothetical protein [candidate division KSB1 bacterium]
MHLLGKRQIVIFARAAFQNEKRSFAVGMEGAPQKVQSLQKNKNLQPRKKQRKQSLWRQKIFQTPHSLFALFSPVDLLGLRLGGAGEICLRIGFAEPECGDQRTAIGKGRPLRLFGICENDMKAAINGKFHSAKIFLKHSYSMLCLEEELLPGPVMLPASSPGTGMTPQLQRKPWAWEDE